MSEITENKSKKLNSYLWVEKYRPSTIDGLVLPPNIKNMFKKFAEEKEIPNLLFASAQPGSGKTSTAKAIVNDLEMEYLYINTSSENGIDTLRTKIERFASSMSFEDKKKAIILDEFDGASVNLQQGLRAAIEEFHASCRFILTCNYQTKIIEPLKSRLQIIDFNFSDEKIRKSQQERIVKRVCGILTKEVVEYDTETVEKLCDVHYPDMRRILNTLQKFSKQNGIISKDIFSYESIDDELYELIINKKFTKAREYIIQKSYNFDELYRAIFDNLVPRMNKECRGQAIILIAQYQFWNSQVVDKEINFSACMLDLINIM